jgi:hypothetical protein
MFALALGVEHGERLGGVFGDAVMFAVLSGRVGAEPDPGYPDHRQCEARVRTGQGCVRVLPDAAPSPAAQDGDRLQKVDL